MDGIIQFKTIKAESTVVRYHSIAKIFKTLHVPPLLQIGYLSFQLQPARRVSCIMFSEFHNHRHRQCGAVSLPFTFFLFSSPPLAIPSPNLEFGRAQLQDDFCCILMLKLINFLLTNFTSVSLMAL